MNRRRSLHARTGRVDPVTLVLAIIPVIAIPVLGWQAWQIIEQKRAAQTASPPPAKVDEPLPDENLEVPDFGGGRQPKASMFAAAARPGSGAELIEFANPGGAASANPHAGGRAADASPLSGPALSEIGQTLQASLALDRNVLIVWLIDSSRSADRLRDDVISQMPKLYDQLKPSMAKAPSNDPDAAPVLSMAATFTGGLEWLTEQPITDPAQLAAMLGNMRGDDGAHEMTFTALNQAVDQVLDYRTRKGRFVTIVVVTDEVGDDESKLDDVLPKLKRYLIPVHVIGQAASFGSAEGGNRGTERGSDADPSLVRQGPESREVEWIRLAYPDNEPDSFRIEIGPYSLERMCIETGGTFYALPQPYRRPPSAPTVSTGEMKPDRSAATDGSRYYAALNGTSSGDSGTFEVMQSDPIAMEAVSMARPAAKVYRPAYVSEQQYRADVASNKAKQALLNAARLPTTEIVAQPQMAFVVGDNDAELTKALQDAQKPIARIRPGLDRLYDTLKQGEADAAKITDRRWMAGYYLALGRAMAAKARADGYIELCAKLINGSKFENDSSNTWQLVRTNEPTGVSVVDRMAGKARDYLNKVIVENPGTPWAISAEHELQVPLGWKWTER